MLVARAIRTGVQLPSPPPFLWRNGSGQHLAFKRVARRGRAVVHPAAHPGPGKILGTHLQIVRSPALGADSSPRSIQCGHGRTRLSRALDRSPALLAPTLPASPLVVGLPRVARHAPCRTVGHVIPQIRCHAHWHYVVCVHVPAIGHTGAVNALPVASVQHRLPPRLVGG